MARGRGGYRPPQRPAPVSNPGSGRRTDTQATQPIRVPTGGNYGDATQLRKQEQAAPMAAGAGPIAAAGQAGNPAQVQLPDAFGPTQRPNQPLGPRATGGVPQMMANDPQMMMRILYSIYPHPTLGRMLQAALKRQRG